jgi:hypothetical protein
VVLDTDYPQEDLILLEALEGVSDVLGQARDTVAPMWIVSMNLLSQFSLTNKLLKVRCHRLVGEADSYKVISLPLEQDVPDMILDLLLYRHDLLSIPVV